MEKTLYKEFYIIVEVKSEGGNRFQVVAHIGCADDETKVVRSLGLIKDFTSEKAAYEYGLEEARTWIDERRPERGRKSLTDGKG